MKLDYNPYSVYANQELYWLPTDTEELYRKNLCEKHELLDKNGWIDKKFTYKFNSHGFRGDEFCQDASIVFLGCSNTVGIGLPWESTWAKIVADTLGLKCFNLGIGGASNDLCFRMAYTWLNKLTPKICVFCQTYEDRLEVWDNTRVVWDPYKEFPEFYLGTWQSTDLNKSILAEKNKLAIEQLCYRDSIKFFHINVRELNYFDLARDLLHNGMKSHRRMANKVLARI
jgi:hypothetical protein